MILPPSFGLFCQRLGAHPYADGRLETFSRDRDLSSKFGLGALLITETDCIRVSIGPRPELDLADVVTGVAGLYSVIDARTDHLIREIEFDQSYRRNDGSWLLTLANQDTNADLWVACELQFADKTVNSIVQVIVDFGRKAKRIPSESKSKGTLGRIDPLTVAPVGTTTISVKERELRRALEIDFEEPKPIVFGSATLAYSGGGNRYLPSNAGPVLQKLNEAPWVLGASTIVEDAGTNVFPNSGLYSKCWNWTATNTPTVLELGFDLPGFSEKLIGFTIQDAKGINSVWQLNFDMIDWSGDTITVSSFTELQYLEGNTSKFWIGVELFEDDGTTLRDSKWEQIEKKQGLSINSATWALASGATLVSGKARISFKMTDLNPGDYGTFIVGFPQIEYARTAGSRTIGIRQADTLVATPSYTFDNNYGRFDVSFSPLYNGVPGIAGAQIFMDTRDSSGRNGVWIGHRPDGLFEFGLSDALGQVFVRSASVIQLVEGETYTLIARWDLEAKNMRLDLNGDLLVERNLNTILVPTILNPIKFGTRFNGTHAGNFQILSFKHELTSE